MNPLDKSALFERASRRASLRPEYLGWVLVRYADAERKTDEELAELLAASMQDLPRLRLCLRPSLESFAADVQQVAEKFGLDAGRLAKVIRHVDALEGMADDAEAHEAGEAGLLLAARARHKKPTTRTKGKNNDARSK